jgi:hypothetical protein
MRFETFADPFVLARSAARCLVHAICRLLATLSARNQSNGSQRGKNKKVAEDDALHYTVLMKFLPFSLLVFGFVLFTQLVHASPQEAIDAFEQDPQVLAVQNQLASQGFKPDSATGATAVFYVVGDEGPIQHFLVSRPYRKGIMGGSALVAAYVRLPGGGPRSPYEQPKAHVKMLEGHRLREALESLH